MGSDSRLHCHLSMPSEPTGKVEQIKEGSTLKCTQYRFLGWCIL